MTVSLAIVTKDSERYIERLLQAGKGFADEIVVAVDSSTKDRTEEICAGYATRLFRIVPTGPGGEKALAWLTEQCTGDWILRLDDDELPSARFVEALPNLIRDRRITHHWIRRRWIVGREKSHWLAGAPWWPDWQLRLFRNIPSIVRVPGRLHTSYIVQGDARYVYEGVIYHYDLVYHPLAQRQEKVNRYEALSPGNPNALQYLVPDNLPTDGSVELVTAIPESDLPYMSPNDAGSSSSESSGQAVKSIPIAPDEVHKSHLWRAELQAFQADPGMFRAALSVANCPDSMTPGELYWVDVEIRNDSPVIWPSPGAGIPEMMVTYHWLHETGETYDNLGLQTRIPHALQPGEITTMPALVRAPTDAGKYRLQWDFLIEQVAWFTSQGWQAPISDVRVFQDASSRMQGLARKLPPGP